MCFLVGNLFFNLLYSFGTMNQSHSCPWAFSKKNSQKTSTSGGFAYSFLGSAGFRGIGSLLGQ